MRGVLGLRYTYLLALAIFLGGTIVIGGIAAPATFAALAGHDPAGGRILAGEVFGEVLRRFYLASYAAGGALFFSLIVMALLGPRPAGFFARAGIAAVMLALTLYSGLVLAAQITRLQKEIGVSVASLAADDARRIRFGQLHGLSSVLMAITGVGGLALLYWEAKE